MFSLSKASFSLHFENLLADEEADAATEISLTCLCRSQNNMLLQYECTSMQVALCARSQAEARCILPAAVFPIDRKDFNELKVGGSDTEVTVVNMVVHGASTHILIQSILWL